MCTHNQYMSKMHREKNVFVVDHSQRPVIPSWETSPQNGTIWCMSYSLVALTFTVLKRAESWNMDQTTNDPSSLDGESSLSAGSVCYKHVELDTFFNGKRPGFESYPSPPSSAKKIVIALHEGWTQKPMDVWNTLNI